jgi:flagellar biosynthesis/type III secretory pathway protein FliH
MSTAQALRRPSFLGRVGDKVRVESAAFKPGNEGRFHPPVLASTVPNSDDGDSRDAANAVAEAKKLAAQFTERTSAAVDLLRATAERLAAEARTDALEIGFLVARRILEMELSASAEPLVNLVRSAVRRLGESRRIAIHLSPTDAQAMNAVIESRGPQAVAQASISRVEIVADPSLGRGDCLVEGDLVTVDGRINARIEELRRVLDTGATENVQ